MANFEYIQKKHIPRKRLIWGMVIAAGMILSALFLLFYPFASSEEESYFKGENPLLFNGKQGGNAILVNKTPFVPFSFLKKAIGENALWDQKSDSAILTTADKVIQLPANSLTYFVNQQPVHLQEPALKIENKQIFVAIDLLLSYYPLQSEKIDHGRVIWVQKDGDSYFSGTIATEDPFTQNMKLRRIPSLNSPYTGKVKKNEQIMIEGEKDGFFLIRKENGIAGYLKKELVAKKRKVTIHINRYSEAKIHTKINGPVQLTWEAVYKKNPETSKIPDMPGVNVISPTWFSLSDPSGKIKSLASLEYVKWAKTRGYQVWGLFSNGFNPVLTHEAFKDFETRQKVINQLLNYCKIYELQGINFDIENVDKTDGPLVTQFIREAAPYLHQANLTISADITFAAGVSNWSSFYERKKLAKIADYIVVMAYDEHWGASSGAGSVASLPWVEHNLKKLLHEVPHDRLILGIPLYARLWKEQTKEDGTTQVSATALTMEQAKQFILDKALTPSYDPKTGQNYVEVTDISANTTYKLWLEDQLSLTKRVDLAVKYQLAGIAAWSRFFGNPAAWTAMDIQKASTLTKK